MARIAKPKIEPTPIDKAVIAKKIEAYLQKYGEVSVVPVSPAKQGEMKVPYISQSLMKSVREYLEGGSCGMMLTAQYIHGRKFDAPSKSMELGIYFEYVLTGSRPKSGNAPRPLYMKSVIKANLKLIEKGEEPKELTIADMYEPYRQAHDNAAKLLKLWADIGLEIAKDKEGRSIAGLTVTKGRHQGTIDVVLRATRDIKFDKDFTLKEGELISGDLKYSGMADDRYTVHGWARFNEPGDNLQKRYHGTQAKEYKFLTDLHQTFWIVDPKGNYILFFWCKIDESAINDHLEEGNTLHKRLMELNEHGLLEARPEYNKCSDCALYNECAHKHTFPHPVLVDLTMGD